jgi:hypothetical protein
MLIFSIVLLILVLLPTIRKSRSEAFDEQPEVTKT